MGLILNIDTSTEICSVCLGKDGKMWILEEAETPQAHAAQLTLLIEKAISRAKIELSDLDAVAVSSGPGSYTGLRIGVSTAKGLCYALDKPLLAVDTLESLAFAAMAEKQESGYYIPMIDARRMEVYTATFFYKMSEPKVTTHAKIVKKESYSDLIASGENIFLCGNGAAKCKEILTNSAIQDLNIKNSASYMTFLSQKLINIKKKCDLAYYTPSYLKQPKITISKKKL